MAKDFGVKVSLPGYDVANAPDQALYFSSSWPILKIGLTDTLTATGGTDTITHKFGYPPLVFIFSHTNGFYPYYITGINSSTVTIKGTANDQVRYYIFRNPLNINFQAPSLQINPPIQGQKKANFGLKFAKPGKDINSTDYRDFTLHSGTKSLMVDSIIYGPLSPPVSPSVNYTLTVSPTTPYTPVYFAFYSADGNSFVPVFAASQTSPKVIYTPITGQINIISTSAGYGAFYALKDPYQTGTQINVVI